MVYLSYCLRKHMRPVQLILIFHMCQLFEVPGQLNAADWARQHNCPDSNPIQLDPSPRLPAAPPPWGPLLQPEASSTSALLLLQFTLRKFHKIVKQANDSMALNKMLFCCGLVLPKCICRAWPASGDRGRSLALFYPDPFGSVNLFILFQANIQISHTAQFTLFMTLIE